MKILLDSTTMMVEDGGQALKGQLSPTSNIVSNEVSLMEH